MSKEYIPLLVEHGKEFVVLGNKNSITYKEVFPYIRDGKCWLGYYKPGTFNSPDGLTNKVNGLARWFTNLEYKHRHDDLPLYKSYDPELYPKYDNYDAIDVSAVKDVPKDWNGVMGVPITFLDKWNPDQFEIIGLAAGNIRGLAGIPTRTGKDGPYVNGRLRYGRIFVRRKESA